MSETPGDVVRVVIADDHALVREGTRELLGRDASIEVVGEAKDGLEALELIKAHAPDVALVDIAMPGLNGVEVTRRVKASQPDVGVLVLTVHDEEPYVTALLEAGAAGYLLKDVPAADLIRAVHAVHRGESVLHPSVMRAVLSRLVNSSAPAASDSLDPLSDRELEVLVLAAQGRSNKQIAVRLEVSPRTVQAHLANIFQKLAVASRTEAVIQALKRGWIDIDELT